MGYLADVLALNPNVHYPLDDEGVDVLDATGNGYHAVMLSLSGAQYVRRVESLVRNSPDEPSDRATLLNTALSATSGVGRVYRDGAFGGPMSGSFTLAVWARWKGGTTSLFSWNGSATGAPGANPLSSIEFWTNGNDIRVTMISQNSSIGSHTFSVGAAIRADSRHFWLLRFDHLTGRISFWLDGVKLADAAQATGIHASAITVNLLMGDTPSAPQRPWRHYMQHASVWTARALTDVEIESLWLSGRDRPGREDNYVDFSEPEYADNTIPPTSIFQRIYQTNSGSVQPRVMDSPGNIGNRVLQLLGSGFGHWQGVWHGAFREPQQRFLTKFNVNAGFNLEYGMLMLGTWDWISLSKTAAANTWIQVRVSNNRVEIQQRVRSVNSLLGFAAFPYASTDWIWLRGEVDSKTLMAYAKAWLDGDPEPADWMVETLIHNDFLYGDGFIALDMERTNTNVLIDVINVGYNSGPPPPPSAPIGVPIFVPPAADIPIDPASLELIPELRLGPLQTPVDLAAAHNEEQDRLNEVVRAVNSLLRVYETEIEEPEPTQSYTVAGSALRILNANSVTIDQLARVLVTLIKDLRNRGVLS